MVDPVFHAPQNRYGRAQFYAPFKQVGHVTIGTFIFNLLILWIMWLGGYIILITGVLGRLVSKLEHKQKEWRTKRIERK
jgi:hypothetical protein